MINREYILRQLQEIQADLEEFTDEELIEHRPVILQRVNNCLNNIGESDNDNIW